MPEHVARRVIVLPGSGYPVARPLLHWTCRALYDAGWHVQVVDWDASGIGITEARELVEYAAERAADEAPTADTTLVVAKSLGTWAAPWASARRLPGVWLTPLLPEWEVAEALTSYAAPSLLIGGTADRLWRLDQPLAGRVVEIPRADHGLEIDDDWRASMAAHRKAVDAIDDFAAGLGAG
ncbi:hypothetical protein VV01_20680 [Luteipulveratus halotolerans]|uniref:Alpha/beta hydrolase n=1 Tax=Luteipulveratus halotolerans TaxID=1631356 RepID=A0A0L6CPG1_9MICO|nr:hypothetical protein VV01_20680 [Luteipulveratus halotolerans]